MHAVLTDLLDLAAGRGTPETAGHVATCAECAAELARLQGVREALRELPEEAPPRDLWPAVREAALDQRERRRWISVGWAVAALAMVITVVAAVRGSVEMWHEARLARETRNLVAESEQLEGTLRRLQSRDRVMSGHEALLVADLEDRLAFVDAQLTSKGIRTASSEETLDLWHERVQLLDALVDAHRTRAAYAGL
jgi:hypothetical protein